MRLLLVEDHAGLRDMMCAHLRRGGYAVDAVGTGGDALHAAALAAYDLALLDLGLPDIDGLEVLHTLRQRVAPSLRVIVLTARDALPERVAGLDAGADDYLVKPFDLDELDARMRTVLRRAEIRRDRLERFGDLVFDIERREAAAHGHKIELTRREATLLEELMRADGHLVVRDALEERLYGFNERGSGNAIEAVVSRLRRRLAGAASNVRIETVRGIGYRIAALGDAGTAG